MYINIHVSDLEIASECRPGPVFFSENKRFLYVFLGVDHTKTTYLCSESSAGLHYVHFSLCYLAIPRFSVDLYIWQRPPWTNLDTLSSLSATRSVYGMSKHGESRCIPYPLSFASTITLKKSSAKETQP